MMKAYVKPELFYERYELSQHIADCGIELNQNNQDDCNANLDGNWWGITDTVFNAGRDGCSIDINVIEAYCYTVGNDPAGKLFRS